MPLEKESECAFESDNEGQTADEENVADGQKAFVEQQQHAQEQKGHSEAGQTDADL